MLHAPAYLLLVTYYVASTPAGEGQLCCMFSSVLLALLRCCSVRQGVAVLVWASPTAAVHCVLLMHATLLQPQLTFLSDVGPADSTVSVPLDPFLTIVQVMQSETLDMYFLL